LKTLKLKQQGITVVEMAIVSTVFFTVLFAVIEVGRLMYTVNVLDEVTRRGARLASVCPVNQTAGVQDRAVFYGQQIQALRPEHVEIRYLRDDGSVIGDPQTNFTDIKYVRARIVDFDYQFLAPFLSRALNNLPEFSTISVAESLGVVPVAPPGQADYGTTSC
jgi:hypothetical protein